MRRARSRRIALLATLPAWLLLSAGCGLFHRTPQPPPVFLAQPPIILPPGPESEAPMPPPDAMTPQALGELPDLMPAGPFAPPPEERRPVETARAANPAAQPQPAPQLRISLDPSQQTAYRRNVQATLVRAQADLQTLYQRRNLGRQAAATRAQADEFVHQAQQALAAGDLIRAQTLADKAETLARFLLGE